MRQREGDISGHEEGEKQDFGEFTKVIGNAVLTVLGRRRTMSAKAGGLPKLRRATR